MMTKLSLWGIYTASYLIDYIVLLLISIGKKISEYRELNEVSTVKFIDYCSIADYLLWGLFIGLIAFSAICVHLLKTLRMNTRIKESPKDNIVWEIAGYVLAQVLTILTIIFSDYWIVMSAIIFLVAGCIFTKAKKVHYSPLFIIPLGYSVFQCDDYVVITNYSKDGMRLALENDPDGVEARELENGIYLIRK